MSYTTVTGPGRVPQFMWGPRLQNTLGFTWPSALDQAKFWRIPHAGSETGQVNDGQDAWIVSRDFMASFTARWLFPGRWAAFQAFLDFASTGAPFSLVPDAAFAPLYSVPGCLLVEPFERVDPTLEDNGSQSIQLVIRNPTYDLGLSWR